MSSLLLRGGRVIDPSQGLDRSADLLIQDGVVSKIGSQIPLPPDCEVLEVAGKIVCPGLIDIHVHLREPGQTAKETLKTGALCAARGGFTTIVCMPNTSPAIDNASTVALIKKQASECAVRIDVTGALTQGLKGEELAPIGSLHKAGVVALTDDGKCVQNNDLMRRVCEYARMFDLPVMDHCQDYGLVQEGVMHEGHFSIRLGLPGWPSAGEEMVVARNILLAELTGTVIHCQHLSAAGSVRLLREARARGVPISGEACPHHFVLTDASIAGGETFWNHDGKSWAERFQSPHPLPLWPSFDTHFKMNPPLRSATDRAAILEGLVDGTLDIIGSDHAPHTDWEKEVEFNQAPFGIVGLEVELSLSLMALYHTGRIPLPALISKFTTAPAKLLHYDDGRGTLKTGLAQDVTVFDPEESWVSDRRDTASKSHNNPFHGWQMRGKATHTIVRGKLVKT